MGLAFRVYLGPEEPTCLGLLNMISLHKSLKMYGSLRLRYSRVYAFRARKYRFCSSGTWRRRCPDKITAAEFRFRV